MDAAHLSRLAALRRADALTMIRQAGTGHTGGTMSCLDVLTVLYYDVLRVKPEDPAWPDRDRFLLSKGHSVEGLWAILSDLGFFPRRELATFSRAGSRLLGHPTNQVPGVEMPTGALGHGLPVGVGMALAARRTGRPFRAFVLMGDGEQAEGAIWEAAMAGAHYGLSNLFAIIDRNGLQISGPTESVMALEDFPAKWRAFGWEVAEIDGHDIPALRQYFHSAKDTGRPHCLIAHTVKGRGLPCAENRPEWHHKVPTREQVLEACRQLGVEEVRFDG